jgi:hypothetical protein
MAAHRLLICCRRGQPGQPGREQADRPGQFGCSNQIAQPLACSNQAELLHCLMAPGQVGQGSNKYENAASGICAAHSSALVRRRGLAARIASRAAVTRRWW